MDTCDSSESVAPYVIEYDKARFPKQKRRPDGKKGCRGCGGELKGRRTAWCSNTCYERYCPHMVLDAAKRRDKGICAFCGHDCLEEMQEWYRRCHARGVHYNSYYARVELQKPKREEYDHIIPFSEGGLTVLENIRTLCHKCHKTRTKEWHATRKKKSKNEITLPLLTFPADPCILCDDAPDEIVRVLAACGLPNPDDAPTCEDVVGDSCSQNDGRGGCTAESSTDGGGAPAGAA